MATARLFERGLDRLIAARAERSNKLRAVVLLALDNVDAQIQPPYSQLKPYWPESDRKIRTATTKLR